jgi:hypothetical protein
MPTVSAIRNLYRKAIDANLGDLNMTAIAQRFSTER